MSALDTVTWRHAGAPLSVEEISAAEQRFGVTMPAAMKALYMQHDGGYIRPSLRFTYDHPKFGPFGTSLAALHPFRESGGERWGRPLSIGGLILLAQRDGRLPDGVIPFGECGGSHSVCLDARTSASEPTIAYLDQGYAPRAIPLAPSFDTFLSMLKPTRP